MTATPATEAEVAEIRGLLRSPRIRTVYLAGPYGSNPVHHTNATIHLAVTLREWGFVPIIPHLSLLTDMVCPRSNDFWMQWDFDIIKYLRPDCIFRMEGDSPGADDEVRLAQVLGIPVFFDIEDLIVGRES